MLTAKKFLGLCAALSLSTLSFACEGVGVAPAADKLIDFGNGWAITNSMATGWVVSAILIGLIIYAVRKPQVMPTKSQAVFESMLEALASEISRSIDDLGREYKEHARFNSLLVSVADPEAADLSTRLGEHLALPIEPVAPCSGVAVAPSAAPTQ